MNAYTHTHAHTQAHVHTLVGTQPHPHKHIYGYSVKSFMLLILTSNLLFDKTNTNECVTDFVASTIFTVDYKGTDA